jgi:virulence-associated protein VagC
MGTDPIVTDQAESSVKTRNFVRSGDVLTIYPARPPISDLVARLAALPRPDAVEVREDEELPERPGL